MQNKNRFLSSFKARLLHQRVRQLTRQDFRAWFRSLERNHPELFLPGDPDCERNHHRIWGGLRSDFSHMTLRMCGNLSGVWNPYILPLEVYASEIEKVLCTEPTSAFLAHKSLYEKCFKKGDFPHVYLHNIDGLYYDEQYQLRREDGLKDMMSKIPYPVVVKPNMHTKGGKDVVFVESPDLLWRHIRGRRNFVVQERIRQHPFFERFNACGVNTLRCCVYRAVSDDSFHVISMALRMGRAGRLDNLGQGGIACAIHNDGSMHAYGMDDFGNKYTQHPDSGLVFNCMGRIPGYDKLVPLLKEVMAQVWFHRLASFDVGYDENDRWRLIEINLRSQTTELAQYAGLPFFGDFSDEVINYCLANRPWRKR